MATTKLDGTYDDDDDDEDFDDAVLEQLQERAVNANDTIDQCKVVVGTPCKDGRGKPHPVGTLGESLQGANL